MISRNTQFATLVSKGRYRLSRWLAKRPWLLGWVGWPITIVDQFGTPGDTLLTAAICRELKSRHPRLRVLCRTPNPILLQHDPNIDVINGADTLVMVNFNYLDIIDRKDGTTNLLKPTFTRLGMGRYSYRSQVFLTEDERSWALKKLAPLGRAQPLVTINVQSREQVKVWGQDRWSELVRRLCPYATVVQLGAADEPSFPGVVSFAGKLSMRESMAILGQASVHVGPVSFLMHAANGLGVPSVIIYGGRETPANSGYAENANLYSAMECSPCWLHDSRGDRCPYAVACMNEISIDQVERAIQTKLSGRVHLTESEAL